MTALSSVTDYCIGTCDSCPAVGSCADRIVCRCLKVTEDEIITAIRRLELRTVKQVKQATGAGDGCTCCHRELQQYLTVYSRDEIAVELLTMSTSR